MVFDLDHQEPIDERYRIELIKTHAQGVPSQWTWVYVGVLADHEMALALGDKSLVQVDIARDRRGGLFVLLNPNHFDADLAGEIHSGCRVLGLASLDPPVWHRKESGELDLRASIIATDSTAYGPAACGYDPASDTGLLFTRRFISDEAGEMSFTLHRTGVHP